MNQGFGKDFYRKPENRLLEQLGLKTQVRKKRSFGKGSFQKSPFSRDSREFRDSRDFREPPDCGKERRIRPFSRDSREFRDFRDSRDSSSQKTPFVMTPFSGPEKLRRSLRIGNGVGKEDRGNQPRIDDTDPLWM